MDKLTILIVDDIEMNREMIQLIFENDYTVLQAADGMEAMKVIESTPVDILITDIFMRPKDGLTCSNTFEWCNQGIQPEIDHLQNIRYLEDLGGEYQDNFNENGIFICPSIDALPEKQRSILKPQTIKSMLQCAVLVHGEFKGYIGFDNCSDKETGIIAVITDIMMPHMDGFELVKNIRANHAYDTLAIVANTQYGEMTQEEKLRNLGVNGFIYKPNFPESVVKKLHEVLNRRESEGQTWM